jgi:hypothetical protein
MRRSIAAVVALAATLALASVADAGGPGMTIGAVEDAAKWSTPAPKMNLARQAGDVPIPGYYDGDAAVDPAIFRVSTGTWLATLSGGGTKRFDGLGVAGDVAIQKRPTLAGGT